MHRCLEVSLRCCLEDQLGASGIRSGEENRIRFILMILMLGSCQVLATCSFDRTAAIWEEMPGDESSIPGTGGAAVSTFAKFNPPPPPASSVNEHEPAAATSLKTHWVKRSSLVDSRTSVTDVKFAPKRMGLILATCSGDGTVRIYEAADVMNLGQWSLQHEIQCKTQASCLSWNHSLSK